jgi:hypothetical protein
MSISASPKSLDERIEINKTVAAAKKAEHRRKQKRESEQRRREKLKAAAEEQAEEHRLELKREKALVDSDVWRQRPPGFLWLGEVSPGRDATSLFEIDAVCERWLRALGLKHEIETLAQREERIFYASQAVGHPYLSASTGELINADAEPWQDQPSDGKSFTDVWVLLNGAHRTMASMPDLSGLPKAVQDNSKPVFKLTLAPKHPRSTETTAEGIPDSTADSTLAGVGTQCMTLRREHELAVRKELEGGQNDRLRAQEQLESAPVALFESEIGIVN